MIEQERSFMMNHSAPHFQMIPLISTQRKCWRRQVHYYIKMYVYHFTHSPAWCSGARPYIIWFTSIPGGPGSPPPFRNWMIPLASPFMAMACKSAITILSHDYSL